MIRTRGAETTVAFAVALEGTTFFGASFLGEVLEEVFFAEAVVLVADMRFLLHKELAECIKKRISVKYFYRLLLKREKKECQDTVNTSIKMGFEVGFYNPFLGVLTEKAKKV